MKTRNASKRSTNPNNRASNHSHRRTEWVLPLLLLLMLSATVQAQYKYTVSEGKVTITGYTGPGGVVTIPEMIAGLPVINIGDHAFYYCTNVTSVTIPDSVISLGRWTFHDCTGLTNVLIGNGVTNIDLSTFNTCTSLTSVTIGNSVATIGDKAFAGCTSLTSVTIPDSVTSIRAGAFFLCTSLVSVNIPDSVTAIWGWAFLSCGSLTNVTIPDSVTAIGPTAFAGCTGLTSLTLSDRLATIEGGVFSGCSSLTSMTIPDSVKTIQGGAFSGCSSLTSVTIPDSVTSLGDYAFSVCTSLTSVTIPGSVRSIGKGAFSGCTGLITIAVNELNASYSSAEGVLFDKNQTTLLAYPGAKAGHYTIPGTVTSIREEAFSGCTGLISLTIPDSVTGIGDFALSGCTNLSRATIGNRVATIGSGAFRGCTGLTTITIPDSVTSIGGGSFEGCAGLTSVTIGNGVTSIGGSAFSGCTGLTSVTIGNGVTSIGGGAFWGCTGLTSVTIGNSLTSIGDGAFAGCTGLRHVYFQGDCPSSIGSCVFCDTPASVYYLPGTTGWGPTFEGLRAALWDPLSLLAYHVIGGTVNIIGYTGPGDAVIVPESIEGQPVTRIEDAAFSECPSLTSITIGRAVTSIGATAFSGCTRLIAITVDESNATYSSVDGALLNKSQITLVRCPLGKAGSYTIPDSVTSIGEFAFSGCTGLTSVTIPDSVTSIRDGAFSGCGNLRGVYFEGDRPTEIGSGVFEGTPATVYYLPGTTGWGETFGDRPTALGHVSLEIALHPGIRVTGGVGTTYVIESKTEVEGDFWLTRGWIELTTPTAIWMDPVPTDSPRKVYRAVKVTKPVVQTIPNMVWIAPGTFTMGSPETERGRDDREGPRTQVTLTKGFWLGKYEVTVGEYLALMGDYPPAYYWHDPENLGELDQPVVFVSWDEAVAYCQRLTEQERAAGRIAPDAVYRLPTEAEWEYACRAGTTTRFSFGDALGCDDAGDDGHGYGYCTLLDSYMWWGGNGIVDVGQAVPPKGFRVGQKQPNPWGLHDMHGNAAEWCQDWMGSYPDGAVVDPQGPSTGEARVQRGGGLSSCGYWYTWCQHAKDCRSASRKDHSPDYGNCVLGFRVLLAPGQ